MAEPTKLSRRSILAAGASMLSGAGAARGAVRTVPVAHEVLAFFYGWYGRARPNGQGHWFARDGGGTEHWDTVERPDGGPYASDDPAVIARQIRQARQAGLTGFVVSWWGIGSPSDAVTRAALAACDPDFKICAYYEGTQANGNRAPGTGVASGPGADAGAIGDKLVEELAYLAETYGSHPPWLKVGTRPVVFVYGRAVYELPPQGWAGVRERLAAAIPSPPFLIGDTWINPDGPRAERERAAFDAQHAYTTVPVLNGLPPDAAGAAAADLFQLWKTRAGETLFIATLLPGFDNSARSDAKPDSPHLGRSDGETYRKQWEAAVAARPDWVLITSWNEWTEGSEIEPSVENGDRDLAVTRPNAERFKRQPARRVAAT